MIDPSVLKSLLQQLDANTKRQAIANIIDESGMNEIIHDYDKFVAAPEQSELKDSYRQNLFSQIEKYKGKNRITRSMNNVLQSQNNVDGDGTGTGGDGGDDCPSGDGERQRHLRLGVVSMKRFESRLRTKGICRSKDGKLIGAKGNKTKYYDLFLNDFGRNISKESSYMLPDRDKRSALKVLGDSGFAQYNIPNQKMKQAYGT